MTDAETPLLPIADAHVHFWNLERNPYPWLRPAEPEGPFGKSASIRQSFSLERYRQETGHQHVARIVHVEAGWDRADRLGEMRWIQDLADRTGAPHAHVAHIDLAAPDAERQIDEHLGFGLFRGVRDRLLEGDFTASGADGTRIADPAWRRGLQALEERRLSFDLQAPPALAAQASRLAADHPDLTFVLTHAGYPPSGADTTAFMAWTDGLRRLAEKPNVVTKLSGLPLAAKEWCPGEARRAAETVLTAFGTDRVLVASNAPVDRLFVPPGEMFAAYREWLEPLPETDQRKVLHDNACRIYRLVP